MGIPEYFEGQTLLVSGGSGFVGKVFVEKVLRSCPNISSMYLLIRTKKGLSVQERWKQITNVKLFDRLKKENPQALEKVKLVESNMKDKDLGLSEEIKLELIENVTLIYHVAATIQFNNNLVDALKENTRSTYILLELAKKMKNLEAFLHVSTTYCNYNRPQTEWEERVYPAVQDWKTTLKLLETEEIHLAPLKEKLLSGHPNVYTLSKNMAENVLQDYCHLFPIGIIRPAIVSSTLHEPMPHWQDGINGLASLCIGTSLGIVRVFWADENDHQDYIPVDKVANTMAIAPWKFFNESTKSGIEVFNCSMGDDCICTTKHFCSYLASDYFLPSKNVLWPPSFTYTRHYSLFYVLFMLQMVLPFLLVDMLLKLSGKEPRLMKIAIKIMVASDSFKDLTLRQITFPNEKYKALENILEGKDKQNFSIRTGKMDILKEIQASFLGICQNYLKEEMDEKTLKQNGERLKRLIIIDRVIKTVLASAGVWYLLKWFYLSGASKFLESMTI